MERDVRDAMDRVGQIEMTVAAADPSPEAERRLSQRAEKLLAWLLSAWDRQHRKEAA